MSRTCPRHRIATASSPLVRGVAPGATKTEGCRFAEERAPAVPLPADVDTSRTAGRERLRAKRAGEHSRRTTPPGCAWRRRGNLVEAHEARVGIDEAPASGPRTPQMEKPTGRHDRCLPDRATVYSLRIPRSSDEAYTN